MSDPPISKTTPGLKTYHVQSANQNYFITPFRANAAPQDLETRCELPYQLLLVSANPAATEFFNHAHSLLDPPPVAK